MDKGRLIRCDAKVYTMEVTPSCSDDQNIYFLSPYNRTESYPN